MTYSDFEEMKGNSREFNTFEYYRETSVNSETMKENGLAFGKKDTFITRMGVKKKERKNT